MEERLYQHPHFLVEDARGSRLSSEQQDYLKEYITQLRIRNNNPVLLEMLEEIVSDHHPFA